MIWLLVNGLQGGSNGWIGQSGGPPDIAITVNRVLIEPGTEDVYQQDVE
jgi:hypothetical protein